MNTNVKSDFLKSVDLTAEDGSTPYLSQCNAIGQAFDVFGAWDGQSLNPPLMDPSLAKKKTFSFLGKEFLVPSYITPTEQTSAFFEGGTYMTRNEFQKSVAANAHAEVGYGLFSGEMKAAYSSEYQSSAEFAYTYNNSFVQLAKLQLGESESFRRESFIKRINDLPSKVEQSNLAEFVSFFNDYGIYYSNSLELGGTMEYYVSVKKTSELSAKEISAMMKAQYNGLYVSGSISASITGSETWKKYSESSNYTIKVVGGDPSLAAKLTAINPMKPSDKTVELYKDWVDSVSSDPAVMDIQLDGIWKMCGDKKTVVQKAWELFGKQIHPKITIETTSEVIDWPIKQSPSTPIITVNGTSIKPETAPTSPVGFQMAILTNNEKIPEVLDTKYISLKEMGAWSANAYSQLYSEIANYINNSQYNKKDNLLMMVSYGLGNNLFPLKDCYEAMKLNGAGTTLNFWKSHCDPGSQMGNDNYWMVSPVNYILLSLMDEGPNMGSEIFERAKSWNGKVTTNTDLFLFKDSITGEYTVGS